MQIWYRIRIFYDVNREECQVLAYSPRFRVILEAARAEIRVTGGIPHDEFWAQVDAEHDTQPGNGHS